MYYLQLIVLCVTVASVIGDLPPGTRRNTYLPPEPTKGYAYSKPPIPFPKPTPTVSFPTSGFPGPRPTPSFPTSRPTPPFTGTRPTFPGTRPTFPRPTPTYLQPTRTSGTLPPSPSTGYPRIVPTPPFPDYVPDSNNRGISDRRPPGGGPDHDHHHHEPGMPFDFNYAVKEDAFGNDYSHNAISDGEVVRGEYKVQLPDGRTQLVRYTADWQHGFSAQVSYDGNPRFDGGNFNRGY
ncbi:leucine-rich repeat extensin-like protein 5 [Mycetomoellerius zeteki]|uniref:leucine-rich repeat extensin-like protein 5 n=1 Tax=Mycetomoellerius zeteki TaxID=64791 RepID=UPI00084E763E|nr:PREDICTED: leucine-rich repeat extensin-like protein 5 [Trachymyrmex zeteki]